MFRQAEWINLAFFVLMSIVATTMRLEVAQKKQALLFGATGVLVTLAGVLMVPLLPTPAAAAFRDWLPVPLVLVAYHQAGRLYTKANRSLEARLERLDAILARPFRRFSGVAESQVFRLGLEASYLLAYPMVPLGLLVLRLEDTGFDADRFWEVVLPATYLCYMMLPFAPTRPPRLVNPTGEDSLSSRERGPGDGRKLNLRILDRLGIGVNTFPSGHVAATTAAALVVASVGGVTGGLFVLMAAGVASSVVIRRYHYAADALLGVALAVVVCWTIGV